MQSMLQISFMVELRTPYKTCLEMQSPLWCRQNCWKLWKILCLRRSIVWSLTLVRPSHPPTRSFSGRPSHIIEVDGCRACQGRGGPHKRGQDTIHGGLASPQDRKAAQFIQAVDFCISPQGCQYELDYGS